MHHWSSRELRSDWLTIAHLGDETGHRRILPAEQRASSSKVPRTCRMERRELRDGHTSVQGSFQSLEKLSREKAVGEVDRVDSSGGVMCSEVAVDPYTTRILKADVTLIDYGVLGGVCLSIQCGI